MARRPLEKLKGLSDSKGLMRIAVVVKDAWVVTNSKRKEHLEMVVCDDQGDEIHVIVTAEVRERYNSVLIEKNTFTLQNFDVDRNDNSIKPCCHPFKLILNGATVVDEVNVHKIPYPGFKFKDFKGINSGEYRTDVLCDIIGAFHEIGYCQAVTGGSRKVQANLILKDIDGELMNCTLWDAFAEQFFKFNDERKETGPVIILMRNAKIKEATDKYGVGVSNAWNGTKLVINADLPEIHEFRKRLPVDDASHSQSLQLTSSSQMLSQVTSFTQNSSQDNFFKEANVLPLDKILQLTQVENCITVVNTVKIVPNPKGWSFMLCSGCSKAAKGSTLPLKCEHGHLTHAINHRYKLDIEGEYKGVTKQFVFWDRDCNQLIGHTAADLHRMMAEAGVTNPLEYPLLIDKMIGRKLACRVKWQPDWSRTISVQGFREDPAFVDSIIEQFPKDEETSKLCATENVIVGNDAAVADAADAVVVEPDIQIKLIEPKVEEKRDGEVVSKANTPSDVVMFETQDLSATAEFDPEQPSPITPAKRTFVEKLISHDLSATTECDLHQPSTITPGKRIFVDKKLANEKPRESPPPQQSSTRLKRNSKLDK